jgi:hypothetical protein
MITYTNIKRIDRLPFIDYMKLPGYSHSYLHQERGGIAADVMITENIRLGRLVDAILMQPDSIDYLDPLYAMSRKIAFDITKQFGKVIKHFISQPSYTADVQYGDFTLPVKGRPDWLLPEINVSDLKITKSRYLKQLIEHMRYREKMWHYCKLAQVKYGYLIIYSLALGKTEVIKVDCANDHNDFWQGKIFLFGKAVNQSA